MEPPDLRGAWERVQCRELGAGAGAGGDGEEGSGYDGPEEVRHGGERLFGEDLGLEVRFSPPSRSFALCGGGFRSVGGEM